MSDTDTGGVFVPEQFAELLLKEVSKRLPLDERIVRWTLKLMEALIWFFVRMWNWLLSFTYVLNPKYPVLNFEAFELDDSYTKFAEHVHSMMKKKEDDNDAHIS